MSHINTTAFRFKIRSESTEELTDRIALWNRVQVSSDHASKVRAKLLELTNAEIARRNAPKPDGA